MSELKQPWFMKDGQIFKYYIHKIKKLAKHMLTDDNFIQSQIWPHRRLNKKKSLVTPFSLAVTQESKS